jgi:NADPH:quinone reductase-like Zn-dependent oxidoreductase
MKAVVYNKKDLPGKLTFCEMNKPAPQSGQVLVKVMATSVNAADYRSLKMGIIPLSRIFGADIAGRVESTGENVTRFKVGDEVIGDLAGCGFGGFAEYAVAPETALVLKPAGLTFEEAAALPLAAVTALQGLRDKGKISRGHEVMIVGSSGGVGTYAVQLARYFGAEVTAVCSTRNVEQSFALGASHVIDYTTRDFRKTGRLYDLILAVNGSYSLSAYKRLLKPGGRYVMAGGALKQVFSSLLLGWLFSAGSRKMLSLAAKPNPEDLTFIAGLAAEGKIRPVIDRRYPLEKVPEAMRYMSEGHATGKVVILTE